MSPDRVFWYGCAVIVFCALCAYLSGVARAWREDRRLPRFTFRTSDSIAMPANADWNGFLITDRPLSSDECEMLRAAVARYKVRNAWPPIDGTQFVLVDNWLLRKS